MEFGQIQIIWTNSDCSLTAGRTSVRPVANHRFTPPSEATGAGPVGTQTAVGTQHAICPNYCICPNLMLKWYHFSTKVGQRGKSRTKSDCSPTADRTQVGLAANHRFIPRLTRLVQVPTAIVQPFRHKSSVCPIFFCPTLVLKWY